MTKEQRSGMERREGWRDRCAACETIQEFTEKHRDGVCAKIAGIDTKVENLRKDVVPRWVFTWIGGATAAAILALSIWTAQKGIDTSERVVRVEVVQDAMAKNIATLVKDSGRIPVEPTLIKEKK